MFKSEFIYFEISKSLLNRTKKQSSFKAVPLIHSFYMSGKKHKLHLFHHFMMSGILIFKGYDKFSHHYYVLGGLIFLFGLIVLSYFLYMLFKQKESNTMHILIHLFEGFASLFTAYIFYLEDKKYIQYGMLLAAIGFFISVIVYANKNRKRINQVKSLQT